LFNNILSSVLNNSLKTMAFVNAEVLVGARQFCVK